MSIDSIFYMGRAVEVASISVENTPVNETRVTQILEFTGQNAGSSPRGDAITGPKLLGPQRLPSQFDWH